MVVTVLSGIYLAVTLKLEQCSPAPSVTVTEVQMYTNPQIPNPPLGTSLSKGSAPARPMVRIKPTGTPVILAQIPTPWHSSSHTDNVAHTRP